MPNSSAEYFNRNLRAAFTQNRKARFLGVWPFATERVLFNGAAYSNERTEGGSMGSGELAN
jgi:hypothetical protein